MKKWIIQQPNADKVKMLTSKSDLSSLCAEVLVSRGIENIEKAKSFFSSDELSSPFLLNDMAEAVTIINSAVEDGKSICIYGDYDCDGITATVVLYSYLECLGANVSYYIPERDEGYGMNVNAVKKLSDDGVELIITVDNGISAIEEAELIYVLGMDLVITDHHQPSEILPKASAIVNPHQKNCTSPFKNLCGAGVVLKLIAAMDDGSYDAVLEQFSDLVAIGTIADVVKLTGENRTIVENGLHLLTNTENLGLSALMEQSKISSDNITSTSVAFMLAPRINAAGRFGSPTTAVKLLLTDDEDEANELAAELSRLNNERKAVEQKILEDIDKIVTENPNMLNERVLIFSGEGWHHGVIGIVSARIVEKYGKPNFIISIDGDIARGSARSVNGFSIFDALTACDDLLVRFGGHMGAGGLSIKNENINAFKERIAVFSREKFPVMPHLEITAEKVLDKNDLTVKAIESLSVLEPFGEGNSRPIFALLGAKVEEIIPLSQGKHSKLKLNYNGIIVFSVLFGVNPLKLSIKNGDFGDFLVYVELNIYNGNKLVSTKIIDYRKSGIHQAKYFAAKDAYEKYMLGEGVSAQLKPRIIPTREELILIYKAIPKDDIPIDNLFMQLNSDSMNYCKFKLCLDIFNELGLIHINPANDTVVLIPATKKVDLESSKILMELRRS